MKRTEYIPIPLILRPLVGLVLGALGLIVLAVAFVFMALAVAVSVVAFISLPITMIFVPNVKVTYK